jgi:hypothetical protein
VPHRGAPDEHLLAAAMKPGGVTNVATARLNGALRQLQFDSGSK